MTAPIDDGGPVYPHTRVYCESPNDLQHQRLPMAGITLRDYAAIEFTKALIASARPPITGNPLGAVSAEDYVRLGLLTADVFIAARKEKA